MSRVQSPGIALDHTQVRVRSFLQSRQAIQSGSADCNVHHMSAAKSLQRSVMVRFAPSLFFDLPWKYGAYVSLRNSPTVGTTLARSAFASRAARFVGIVTSSSRLASSLVHALRSGLCRDSGPPSCEGVCRLVPSSGSSGYAAAGDLHAKAT